MREPVYAESSTVTGSLSPYGDSSIWRPADAEVAFYRTWIVPYLQKVGLALLVGFVAGAIFLLGQLVYAQLVLMPRLVAGGGSLAVGVDVSWALRAAGLVFVVYLVWLLWPGRRRR